MQRQQDDVHFMRGDKAYISQTTPRFDTLRVKVHTGTATQAEVKELFEEARKMDFRSNVIKVDFGRAE